MLRFSQIADSIAATSSKLAKTALVADYFRSLPPEQASIAATFFSGRPFAVHSEATLQVGGSLLWRVIADFSGKSERQLTALYRRHGDPGAVAADALPAKAEAVLSLADVQSAFVDIAASRGLTAKAHLLRQLLERATQLEAKYIVKIISGDLRIGLKESLVEEAIARAFSQPLEQVQRANMLLGDIGETLHLAAVGRLAEARMRLFHPIGFMLASPVASAEEALSEFASAAVEDKYDGIRAQAHISQGEARLFSRTRDEITESFPELVPALAAFPRDAILDGEIVAWASEQELRVAGATASQAERNSATGRALPFSTLQQRLGRKKVSTKLMHEVPVAFLVFDILYSHGELLLQTPLRERQRLLAEFLALPRTAVARQSAGQTSFAFEEPQQNSDACILQAAVATAHSPAALEQLFIAARSRGNEGLMIKDLDSLYTPGRRGRSWLKMKRELATLDVVVTAVEYGHGKRIGVLSDYTFAVWDGDRLVNIGKAYSGLTDAEIAEMTDWFLAHKISEQGLRLEVEPKIVLEVAFNNMMRSTRHESGYALRFPRIVRLRLDKLPEEADTIQAVEKIFTQQHEA
jgi:DNA ligase 1